MQTTKQYLQVQESILAGMLRMSLYFELSAISTNPAEHVQCHEFLHGKHWKLHALHSLNQVIASCTVGCTLADL